MKRYGPVVVLIVLGMALSGLAAAEECKFHNLRLDFAGIVDVPVDFPWLPPDFWLECVENRVRGTLIGTAVACVAFGDVKYDLFTSTDLWGDSPGSLVAKQHAIVNTRHSEIHFLGRTVIDFNTGAQVSIFEVKGGTERYEGATGVLTMMPKWPRGESFRAQGSICTPDNDDDSDSD